MPKSSRRNRELKLLIGALLISSSAFAITYLARERTPLKIAIAGAALFTLFYIGAHIVFRLTVPHSDPMILPLVCLLTGLSLTMIYRLSDKLILYQFMWVILGVTILCLTIVLLSNYKVLENYKYSLGLVGLILLLSTIRLGKGFFEPNLWLRIGPFSFQPSEIAKILIVIFFAAYLKEKKELLSVFTRKLGAISVPEIKHLGPLLLVWAISLGLLVIQKDLGASLLFFGLFLAMLFVATNRAVYVALGSFLFLIGATLSARVFTHVADRIAIWLNPWQSMGGKSFQLVQSLFAIASGGFWGTGLGRGYPNLVPAIATDFIFSAFAEEIGLVGTIALIALYLVVVARGFKIALKTEEEFGKLLAAGLTTVFALQTFVIIGGVTRVVPLTGITLPFLSYGGSSIVSNFILVGLLLLISNQSIEEASEIK